LYEEGNEKWLALPEELKMQPETLTGIVIKCSNSTREDFDNGSRKKK